MKSSFIVLLNTKNNMKVLLINKYNFLQGGADGVFLDTKKVLEKNGHKVSIFAMKSSKNLKSRYEKFFVDEVEFKTVGGVFTQPML